MKRKRGNKKGNAKKPKLVGTNEVESNVVSVHTEENSALDESDNEGVDSTMDALTETKPSPPESTQPEKVYSLGRPIDNVFGRAVYTRVKVRLKTSKNLETKNALSDVPAQSDTDIKSSQQVVSEKQEVPNEKTEEIPNSLSETNGGVSGSTSKKSVGIKNNPNEKTGESPNSLSETNGVVSGNTFKKSVGVKINFNEKMGESPNSLSETNGGVSGNTSKKSVGIKNNPNEKTGESPNSLSETNGGVSGNTSKKSVGIKNNPNEKTGESPNSLSETNGGGVSGNTSKKSVGIKIKSSKGFGLSSMSPCSNTETVKVDKTEKKETILIHQESRFNEQELKLALEVIKKVMAMDAAAPFNVPVNPVALGIPDYFDVIDTPMDFGTICSNLEKGVKYMNSEDVFKDVEYVWNNCFKYNNKGDYIVELMKRVKKNFIKYWTTVGLFNEQSQEANGIESNPVKEGSGTPSSQGNTTPVDSGALSLSTKKFHGLKKHKEGCQCAICVMMRRRQEREEIARMMGGPVDGSDDSLGEDMNREGTSHGQSLFGEYDSPHMRNSPDTDVDMERKGHEMKLGHVRNFYHQQPRDNDILAFGKGEGSQTPNIGSGSSASSDTRKEMQNEDGSAVIDQQKPKEVLDKKQRARMLENLRYLDNPMLLELSGTLFAEGNSKSFWNGPHSLLGRNHGSTRRRSSFHSAISSFMK